MSQGMRGRLVTRVPGVGWRERRLRERAAQVADLERQNARLRRELQAATRRDDGGRADDGGPNRASFLRSLLDLRRSLVDLRTIDAGFEHPQRQLPFKLRNYRLAASHGIRVPEVLRTWTRAEDIDLAGLPPAFVVKSDGGAGGHGVLPLATLADGRFQLLDGTAAFTQEEIRERLAGKTNISGPFFAEEVLRQPGGGPIPDDVKLYVFYGEVGQVLLRRMPEHARLPAARYRYLDGHGQDLGDVAPGHRIDAAIPEPRALEEMIALARHVSRAVPVPFLRVDFYDTAHGAVLGEITRVPGGAQRYRAETDEAMGRMWEAARWRLDLDLVRGRPAAILHGEHPAPNHYPADHPSQQPDPGSWGMHIRPCQDWCQPGGHG